MKTKREFLSSYSVKVNVDNSFRGSGILVPINKDTCYLITAKHNFDIDENKPYSKSLLDNLDYQNIQIYNDENQEVCKISKVVYQKDEKEDDLIIFDTKDTSEFIKELDPISILKDEPDDEVEHFFRGYPQGKVDLMDGLFSRNFDKGNPNIFTFKNQHQIEAEHLKGYSGSGVFIKEKATFYLVGILLESKDGNYYYTCYDLSKVIDEINKNISPKIRVKENILDITPTDTMYTRMINRNKKSFLVKRAEQIFNTNSHVFKDLDDRAKLIKLANYIKNTNKFDELEQEYQKKLADLYLLGAFIFKEYDSTKKAEIRKFFEKAKMYDARYIRYTNNLEGIDSEKSLKLGKLAYIDKKFDKAKKHLENALHTDSKRNKIEIYELLVKEELETDKEKLIERYEELVKLYKENTIQKAEALYQLSLLYEDKENKIKKCKEAMDIIENNDNPLNYELKFKIYKQVNQVLGEPIHRNLRPILEKLVQKIPSYKEELDVIIHLEELEKKGEKLTFELEETKDISYLRNSYLALKDKDIEDLTVQLEEAKHNNNNLSMRNWMLNNDLTEIYEMLKKAFLFVPIVVILGIIIGIYGKFSIFDFILLK